MRIIVMAALAASVLFTPSHSAFAADTPKPLFDGSDVISITLSALSTASPAIPKPSRFPAR